jgi:hypothetical protein
MTFKLVSKNNMGIVITLILVILLSQSKFFNFLIDTYFGRLFLLALIIFIAYTNKILGLFAVLCVIIMFNYNDMNYVRSYNFYEGFDGSGNTVDASGNAAATSILQDKIAIDEAKKNILQQKLNVLKQKANNASSTTTNTSATTSTTSGTEGFCMTDRENNMLRGKQSNAVPVFNNSRQQDDYISPSDKSVFSGEYASF